MARVKKDTRGRKLKLTATLVKKVKELASKGYPDNVIYPLMSVSHQTFYNWKNTGKEISDEEMEALEDGETLKLTTEESLYVEFFESLESGQAKHKADLIDKWLQASEPILDDNGNVLKHADWRAIESFLKRRDPDQFGEVARSETKTELNITNEAQETGVMVVPVATANPADFEKMVKESQAITKQAAKTMTEQT